MTKPLYQTDSKAGREIEHGRRLAANDTEHIWGWGTPAGKIRARRRAILITEGAGLGPGSYALEIGCGTGLFTEMFAQTGADITAVDISPELLEKAKKREIPESQVRFILARFEDMQLEGPFDAVIGSSVLHHLDLTDALTHIHRLLKPGGSFSFAEPNMLNPQIFLERTFSSLPFFSHVSPDETAFIRYRLKRDLLRTGFEQIDIQPFDWLHPATPEQLIGLIGKFGRLLEKTAIVREFSGSLIIKARRSKAS